MVNEMERSNVRGKIAYRLWEAYRMLGDTKCDQALFTNFEDALEYINTVTKGASDISFSESDFREQQEHLLVAESGPISAVLLHHPVHEITQKEPLGTRSRAERLIAEENITPNDIAAGFANILDAPTIQSPRSLEGEYQLRMDEEEIRQSDLPSGAVLVGAAPRRNTALARGTAIVEITDAEAVITSIERKVGRPITEISG